MPKEGQEKDPNENTELDTLEENDQAVFVLVPQVFSTFQKQL